MPYRRPPAREGPAIVRLAARHSNVVVFGALFFVALAAYFVSSSQEEQRALGFYIGGGLVLLGVGLLYFTSTGVDLDIERRGVVHWQGPGFRLRARFTPISEEHRLELRTKTVTHRASGKRAEATLTSHTLAFVRGEERVLLAETTDRNEARRRAELTARSFETDLHEDNEGTERVIPLGHLDEPLRVRLIRDGAPKRPKKPTKHALEYQRDGERGSFELPLPRASYKPLLVYAASVAAVVFFFFNRGTDSQIPFMIGMLGYAVLLGAILRRLFHHRTRARREACHIVASPEGLELTLKGMVRTREARFGSNELEDLDVVQVGNDEIYALLARSDEQEVMFGAGTPRPALRWVRKAIAYHLTR